MSFLRKVLGLPGGGGAADSAIPLPGEATLELEPGKVKFTYQEGYKAKRVDGRLQFAAHRELEVTVRGPGGEAIEMKGPGFRGMGSSTSAGPGWSRALVGSVEIETAGSYTVSAPNELPGAVEPQLLVSG